MVIVDKMIEDIDIILKDYKLDSVKVKTLQEYRNKIFSFYKKYENVFSKYRILMEFSKYRFRDLTPDEDKRANELQQIGLKLSMKRGSSKFDVLVPFFEYTIEDPEKGEEKAKKFYSQFYEELLECFEIEDKIQEDIVIPIWKNYINSVNDEFAQGDRFAYLFHSSDKFINLPGSVMYQNKKKGENDVKNKMEFISSSLITDKEMETGNTNVGITLKMKNKTILAASPSDCGTRESNDKAVNNVKAGNNG